MEKVEELMKINFNTGTTYADDNDKYIKTKTKYIKIVQLQIFIIKKYQKKKYHTNVYQ